MATRLKDRKLIDQIRMALILIIMSVFSVSLICIIIVQISVEQYYAYSLLERHIKDIVDDIAALYDSEAVDYMGNLAHIFEEEEILTDDYLIGMVLANRSNISEINIIDKNGIIRNSSNPDNVGYDMASDEASKKFLCLLDGEEFYSPQKIENVFDANDSGLRYFGYAFSDGSGFIQVGLNGENYSNLVDGLFMSSVVHRRIGIDGIVAVVDKNTFEILNSTNSDYNGKEINEPSLFSSIPGEYCRSKSTFFGARSYIVTLLFGNFYIVGTFPAEEIRIIGDVYLVFIILLLIFVVVFIARNLQKSLKRLVVNGIEEINISLAKITAGDFDERADVDSSPEFLELSNGINITVDRLKQLIVEAATRIDEELKTAKEIQQTSLPNPVDFSKSHKSFSLYSSMDTAKIVGGDFYDFYMLPGNILAVTIADVSDKGIPAAMFMMKAKALLKRLAEEEHDVGELVTSVNKELWDNNEGDMFVTVWIGFIDLQTGVVKYVHAGHTCPVHITSSGPVFIKQRRQMMIGGMPDVKYQEQEFKLNPGDVLFMYTDGVTEAFNVEGEEYGNERLLSVLSTINLTDDGNETSEQYCKQICEFILDDVRKFTKGEIQADDITMLCVKYFGYKDKEV